MKKVEINVGRQRKETERNGPTALRTENGLQFFVVLFQMWNDNVRTDLELDSLSTHIPFQLTWGSEAFQEGLDDSTTLTIASIKQRQLPLLGLRTEELSRKSILADLKDLASHTAVVDDCLEHKDERITESIEQILWPSD